MESNVQPMACGNCGNGMFKMFKQQLEHGFAMLAECASCLSVTRIETRPAELVLNWGEGADGILCPMEPKAQPMSELVLRDACERAANAAYDRLTIPGYTVAKDGPWVVNPEEAALSRTLRLDSGTPGGAVDATFVVRFVDTQTAEVQDAYVLLGEHTILASVSPDALRPSANRG